ncbi:MAG: hypothetical protein NWF10_05160 [Candidatus Bathyarchaeota archaeon]|nr:hypothetical protein [Candidatus Bathyarchaeota archaeon]
MLGKRGSSKDIADFLHCLSFLENRTSTLYKKLSDKTVNSAFSDSFLKISQNTKKHSETLDEIAKKISRPRIGDKECAKRLATAFKSIEKVTKKIKHKKLLSNEDLSEIISILEGSLGEESYMLIQAKTFLAMAPQISRLYGVHLENFKKLLYSIVADEEAHMEMFENIKVAIDKKLSKKEASAPTVKYKNPDSWIAYV